MSKKFNLRNYYLHIWISVFIGTYPGVKVCLGQESVKLQFKITNPRFYIPVNLVKGIKHFDYSRIIYDRGFNLLSGSGKQFLPHEIIQISSNSVVDHRLVISHLQDFRTNPGGSKYTESQQAPLVLTTHASESYPTKLVLWNAEYPVWYSGSIIPMSRDGEPSPKHMFYQSVRTFQIQNGIPILNGKSIKLKPVKYLNRIGNTEKIRSDLTLLHNHHVNAIVLERYNNRILQLCDSIGIYAIVKHEPDPALRFATEKECYEYLIRTDYLNNTLGASGESVLNYASLLFFYSETGSRVVISALNRLLDFYNRDPKNFYSGKEMGPIIPDDLVVFQGDSDLVASIGSDQWKKIKEEFLPINVNVNDLSYGEILLKNSFDFKLLSNYQCKWEIKSEDGILASGIKSVPDLLPGKSLSLKMLETPVSFLSNKNYTILINMGKKDVMTPEYSFDFTYKIAPLK